MGSRPRGPSGRRRQCRHRLGYCLGAEVTPGGRRFVLSGSAAPETGRLTLSVSGRVEVSDRADRFSLSAVRQLTETGCSALMIG